ncbi:hypothetical protein J4466_04365 [Candidatus Pacearchaeota archaeon]|nr:hypothetical protein [Candidatus Pacearchaeota archaeon]
MNLNYQQSDEDKTKDENDKREKIIDEIWHGIRIKIIKLPDNDNYINYKPNLN